jgi:hypothetical protein
MHNSRQTSGRWTRGLGAAIALLVAFAPGALSAQQAQGTIRGKVTNAAAGAPLGNAQVFVAGTQLGALTNADGSYSIAAVPPGTQVVRVRLIGYQPTEKSVSVTAGLR